MKAQRVVFEGQVGKTVILKKTFGDTSYKVTWLSEMKTEDKGAFRKERSPGQESRISRSKRRSLTIYPWKRMVSL